LFDGKLVVRVDRLSGNARAQGRAFPCATLKNCLKPKGEWEWAGGSHIGGPPATFNTYISYNELQIHNFRHRELQIPMSEVDTPGVRNCLL